MSSCLCVLVHLSWVHRTTAHIYKLFIYDVLLYISLYPHRSIILSSWVSYYILLDLLLYSLGSLLYLNMSHIISFWISYHITVYRLPYPLVYHILLDLFLHSFWSYIDSWTYYYIILDLVYIYLFWYIIISSWIAYYILLDLLSYPFLIASGICTSDGLITHRKAKQLSSLLLIKRN